MPEAWKTVRVFVSSTFKDMHAERDYLVKMVFPELRDRCAKRRLRLVDLDLRWGVTEEEAEQGNVLHIILDEIDRSRPFFVAILGERYGFILDKLPKDAELSYPWLRDYSNNSLTALEIIHGVLRQPDLSGRSFFYFRDPQFISQVPESKRADFLSENPEAMRKLGLLKDKIRASGRPVMENYPCRWDNAEGRLVDLNRFGQQVLDDLWAAICTEFPEEVIESDPVNIQRRQHEDFAEERSYLYKGRTEQTRRLTQYILGTDRRHAVITGVSGCGKSAFLASWYRRYTAEAPNDLILAYFIGASPDSTDQQRLLRNLCHELKRKFTLREELPEDDKKLSETMAAMLISSARYQKRIVIVIDGLDELSPTETDYSLHWLLDYIPENIRLVVSSSEGDCLNSLRHRDCEEIKLPPLTENEQRQIVEAVLSEWRRKLDERQMKALLVHREVVNPLYLRTALEELRQFGKFEQLTDRIRRLADDIRGLFGQMLGRLEADYGHDLVMEVFSLIDCSRYGLSEDELLELLSTEKGGQIPRAPWARLARGAGSYLVKRGELFSFSHQQLVDAIRNQYRAGTRRHAELAEYFKKAPPERKLEEYPYQLQRAEEWQDLSEALSDLDFFDFALQHHRNYEWMGYWQILKGRFKPERCYQAAIKIRKESEGETEFVARLMYATGLLLSNMGLNASALSFTEHAAKIFDCISGPEYLNVADCFNLLGILYQGRGRYADALSAFQRSLEIRKGILADDHPDVLESISYLANLYLEYGKFDMALPLYQRVMATPEHALGSEQPIATASINGLALLNLEQGRYEEALTLFQKVLASEERIFGLKHPRVATCINNIAETYRRQGKYIEALPLYQRSLEIRERTFGPHHPEVAESLNNISCLYSGQARFDEAMPFAQRALSIRENTLGPDHSLLAQSLNNLAWIYYKQGKHSRALPLFRQALNVWERALGPNNYKLTPGLNNLASIYVDQGRYDMALPLYQRALAITERSLGTKHPDVATCLNSLANLYVYTGKYDKAQSLFERALSTAESALGRDHPNTRLIRDNLKTFLDVKADGKQEQAGL